MNPTSVVVGVLAVCVVAYVAAVLLTWDAGRLHDEKLVAYFRSRAVGAAVVTGVLAVVGLFVLRGDARYVFDGLTSRALPLVALSALAGAGAFLLLRGKPRRGARVAALVASGALVLAWGLAQWDYLLPETLTVSQAAAPTGTITAVLLVAALAVLFIAPAFALLYTLDQKSLLPDEGVHDGPQQPTDLG
jgi:cytochrome d ubiquinol oxidase subunit II